MTDQKYDAPEDLDAPADQPELPSDDKKCDLPESCPPDVELPYRCKPDPACCCPPGPDQKPGCLEDLIEGQTGKITAGDKAKAFKADLQAFLEKAKAASADYTRDKYEQLVKRWQDEDKKIVDLIGKLECALKCWRCVIECYVCPLLYDLKEAEDQLNGPGTIQPAPAKVHNLYDLLHWHTRERAKKQAVFDRIKAVLGSWEKPAQTIDAKLTDNAKLIDDISKALGTDPTKVVYDLFLKLIPMHLAIAPPKDKATTGIKKRYTRFCRCDKGAPQTCCGPNAGALSLRERLIGPQPYLIDPNAYYKIICCLVDQLYRPANEQLSQADAWVTSTTNRIQRAQATVDNGLKTFEKDAKAAIPSAIDCDHLEPKKAE